jgi:hypothetical protein
LHTWFFVALIEQWQVIVRSLFTFSHLTLVFSLVVSICKVPCFLNFIFLFLEFLEYRLYRIIRWDIDHWVKHKVRSNKELSWNLCRPDVSNEGMQLSLLVSIPFIWLPLFLPFNHLLFFLCRIHIRVHSTAPLLFPTQYVSIYHLRLHNTVFYTTDDLLLYYCTHSSNNSMMLTSVLKH